MTLAAASRPVRAALAFAVLVLPGAAGAGEGKDWETSAFDKGGGCYTARFVDKDVMVGFHQMQARGEFRITLSGTGFDALVADGERDGPIDVALSGSGAPRTLTSIEGYAMHLDDTVEGVAAIWYDPASAAVRAALARARSMTLSFKGDTIGTYPLDRPGQALEALAACVAGLDKV